MIHLLAVLALFQFTAGSSSFSAGPIPQPPPGSVVYSPSQAQTGGHPSTWNLTTGTAACSPSCPALYGGTNAFAFGVTSPSLSSNATKLSSTTQAANYAYNTLAYSNWLCSAGIPATGTSTTATLTINQTAGSLGAYVVNSSNNSVTFAANATDTTYTVTAILIYIDGSSTASFNSSTTGPITPISTTISGLSDSVSHTYAIKAFNSNGGSSLFSGSFIFGPPCGGQLNVVETLALYTPSTNAGNLYAYEVDPRLIYGGYIYEAAYQCRLIGTAPVNAWYVWSGSTSSWVLPNNTTYPCNPVMDAFNTMGSYNTIVQGTHQVVYNALTFNGVVVYRNLNFAVTAATTGGANNIGTQFQLDGVPNASGAVTIYEIVDKMSLSVF